MKLILHIGTHKTASTSIQRFCAQHQDYLEQHGIFYPSNSHHFSTSNFLASLCAKGPAEQATKFFQESYKKAQKRNCHTVLISAEMFYAMSSMFYALRPRRGLKGDYWKHEDNLVRTVHNCCDIYENKQVVCCLRGQAAYADSMYAQMAKQDTKFFDTFPDFVDKIAPMLDYDQHIKVWEEQFGAGSIQLLNFETLKKDPIRVFCADILGLKLEESFDLSTYHFNTRFYQDILAAKITYLRSISPEDRDDKTLQYQLNKAFRIINKSYKQKETFLQEPASFYKERFASFEKGNQALSDRYKEFHLDAIPEKHLNKPAYSGLNEKKKHELFQQIDSLLNSPSFRFERYLKKTLSYLKNYNIVRIVLPFARSIRTEIRKKLQQSN